MPQVHGADVSHHQPPLDLTRARDNGLRFLYHKVSEGTSMVDPEYDERRAKAKLVGIPFGGYHFARPDGRDAADEARFFLKHAAVRHGDLVPALDLEVTGGLSQAALNDWALQFSKVVERRLGVTPVLYSPWALKGRDYTRWVPRYNNAGTPPVIPWDIWQFTDGVTGRPNSFAGLGNVDLNTLNDGVNLRDIRYRRKAEWTFVTFNVWVGQKPAKLRANLIRLANDTGRPDVICLQEAKHWHGTIPGYERVEVDSDRPEADSTILLVRKRGLDVVRDLGFDVQGPDWVGPKHGQRHKARSFPGAVVRDTVVGGRVSVLGLHRTPGGPRSRNEASWNAEHRAIVEWAKRREANAPRQPKVLLGDLNTRLNDNPKDPQSLARLAKQVGTDRVFVRGVDGALVIDGKVSGVRELKDRYGSDKHNPVAFTVTAA